MIRLKNWEKGQKGKGVKIEIFFQCWLLEAPLVKIDNSFENYFINLTF